MSLDICLRAQPRAVVCECERCGNEHVSSVTEDVFSANITHNLASMAKAAGIYQTLWRPAETGALMACHLVDALRTGLAALRADPARFEALNPPNGWGTFDGLVAVVEDYLAACIAYPTASIEACR